tara:strand:+ start:2318 stop:3133 length:816 start_codon:yes stop_codon:yes gene_type:complete
MDIFKEIEENNFFSSPNIISKYKKDDTKVVSLIQEASRCGYIKTLKLIKKHFFDIFIKNINIVLINLVINNNKEGIKYFLNKNNIDFSKENVNINADFLTFAAKQGNLELVKLIIENKNFLNNIQGKFNEAILKAAEKNKPNVVLYLLSTNNIHFKFVSNRILMYFARHGDIKLCKKIIEYDKNSIFTPEPLIYSCEYNHIDIVKYLISTKKFNPSALNNICILNAYDKKQDSLLKLLFEYPEVRETLFYDSQKVYNYAMKFDIEKKIKNF